jgi:hypothetical protein
MELSDNIITAMIGAGATVTAALFQLFSALSAKGKPDAKPRRGLTLRSIVAVLVLMMASAAGGFFYSELLKPGDSGDIASLRQELRELRELTASSARNVEGPEPSAELVHVAVPEDPTPADAGGQVESIVYVPACRRIGDPAIVGSVCTEAEAQRVALCASIPSYARTYRIELFTQRDALQHPWEQHRVDLESDLGGARFTGRSFEYAQGDEKKAVCTTFLQWSSEHPHIARIVVHYGFGDALDVPSASPPERTPLDSAPAAVSTALAVDPPAPAPQTASFVR